MKNLLVVVLICAWAQITFAQDPHRILVSHEKKSWVNEITMGVSWGVFGTHQLQKTKHGDKPFHLNPLIWGEVDLYTTKNTHHQVFYDLGENSIGMLNGMLFGKNHHWEAYLQFSVELLDSPDLRTIWGVERIFLIESEKDPWFLTKVKPYLELGLSATEQFVLSVGVTVSNQFIISKT